MYQAFDIKAAAPARSHRVRHGAGIVRLHPAPLAGKLALLAFALISVLYFAYRIPLWNPAAPILSGLLLAAELFGTLTLALHVISTWNLVERVAPPVHESAVADIFLTTWNESEAILRHTILAAQQVSHCRYVWLLDDGDRTEMAELAAQLGIRYLSRQDRSHAKAGNLNNAIGHTDADFVAIFDCDHAPSPDFFERTLGYFDDPSIGLVQTPQDFYNIDSFQHRSSPARSEAWHEQTLFYRVIQGGKDYWNATFFCGSCAIVRRRAIEDIGGFATGTITEDMHTSLRLHKRGWSVAYHAEALAFGLSPTDLEQYETQRLRWGRGAMQVWAKEGILTARGLSLSQRIAYFTSAITYFEGWQKAIVYLMPIVVLATGRMPIIWTGLPFMALFSAWLLFGIIVNEIFSRGYSKSLYMEEYNFLRFFTFMRATLALVIPRDWGFTVTPKNLTSKTGIPLSLWPQMLVGAGAIIAIAIGFYRIWHSDYLPTGAFVANVIWAALVALIAARALRFASGRSKQRRADHRFSVPVPARLIFGGNGSAQESRARSIIIDEISSNGFSFRWDAGIPLGDTLSGRLTLPGGRMQFSADIVQVRPAADKSLHRVSARFRWMDRGAADLLDSFLYGSTLQWDVNGWAETRPMPYVVRRLRRIFRKQPEETRWRFANLHAAGEASTECIARKEQDIFRVLSLAPFPATADLTLSIGRQAEQHGELALAGYRSYPSGGGMLHMAVLHDDNVPYLPGYHREPSWMRKDNR